MKLSLLIIACNEELRLPACVASARSIVDEVVIVVQSSTDGTLALANSIADVVVEDECRGFCEPSRPLGLENCRGDWVLTLDADEELTEHGRTLIPVLCASKRTDFYRLRRLTTIESQVIEDRACGRLFRRQLVSTPVAIHHEFLPTTSRHMTIGGDVVISHAKTWGEQHADNSRYAKLA